MGSGEWGIGNGEWGMGESKGLETGSIKPFPAYLNYELR
ncbi:hypothetical protein GXM_03662 [Nostoc sphaeroides CCNUC1]|uniref:Uncharacterized protein n=1 Tax=Nostoc sphaeroides CCNUC1 TaxID=2653204 RepID=A0A5P8W0I9_9NOSO|nr:hypothetical protein GXM_03662 [Nostoc sphaeroides CCNUC1]